MKLRKKMLCMVKQVKKITIFACLVCVVYPVAGIQAAVGEQQSVAQTLKKIDPTQVGNIEKNKYSYNSGQPLQLACLLYKITQENSYLNLAKQIAEACHNKWFKQFHSDILKRDFKVLSPGHAWFNTIMCRGFFELYSIDKNSLYLEDIHSTMLHAWFGKAHHNNGLINNEDLSGLSGDIPTEDGGNKWQILHQGALVELYARLAVWEKKQN